MIIHCRYAAGSFLVLDQLSRSYNHIVVVVVLMMLTHDFVVYTLTFLLSFFTVNITVMRSSCSIKIIDFLMYFLFLIAVDESFDVSPSIVIILFARR